MTLGEKIAALRKQNRMTQVELAEKLHTTKQTIGKYEKGIVTNLPLYRINELAEALGTTPEYLCGWEPREEETAADLPDKKKELVDLVKQMPDSEVEALLTIIKRKL